MIARPDYDLDGYQGEPPPHVEDWRSGGGFGLSFALGILLVALALGIGWWAAA